MSAGMKAAAQMNRGLSHPAGRGQSFVARASNSPAAKNSSRFDSGTSQTNCRLIRYIRSVTTMLFKSTLVPTSSHPAARPHHPDSTTTSSAASCRTGPELPDVRIMQPMRRWYLVPGVTTFSSRRAPHRLSWRRRVWRRPGTARRS